MNQKETQGKRGNGLKMWYKKDRSDGRRNISQPTHAILTCRPRVRIAGHPWSDLVNIERCESILNGYHSFDAEQPRSRVPLVNVRRLGGLSERIGGRRDEGGLRRMIRQEWDDEYQPVNAVDPNHTPVKPDHVRSAHTQGSASCGTSMRRRELSAEPSLTQGTIVTRG